MHAHDEQVEWGPIYLASGITTVRDVGNELNFIGAVRDAIAAGRGIGPRMLLAGIVDGDSPRAVGVERVATADQAVAEVRKYHNAGFQQMKLYSSLSPEMVKAVATEAHRMGMTVTGHVPEGMDGFQGVEAGMDQINHISFIRRMMLRPPDSAGGAPTFDPASREATRAVSFLKDHGTVVDPTVALYESASSRVGAGRELRTRCQPRCTGAGRSARPHRRAPGRLGTCPGKVAGVSDHYPVAPSGGHSNRGGDRPGSTGLQSAPRAGAVPAGRLQSNGSDSGRHKCACRGDGTFGSGGDGTTGEACRPTGCGRESAGTLR